MHRKVIILIAIVSLIILPVLHMSPSSMVRAATTIYVDSGGGGDYTTIQAAIDNANESDTIYVYSGTYNENIVVDKALTLSSESSTGTIIAGAETGNVVTLAADAITLSGFTVQNPIGTGMKCVMVNTADDCTITNCLLRLLAKCPGINVPSLLKI